jgi:predicted ester cyclase
MDSTPRATPAPRARRPNTAAACVRRVVEEACNNGDLGVLDTVLPPPAVADEAQGRGGASAPPLRAYLAAFRAAVPDARWTIVQQIAQGDPVGTRLAVQGTFSGPLLGLAPPGRPATLTGVAISRFTRGRLVELWLRADLLGLLEQLELLPPLDLPRAVAMAQVARAGALLAGPRAPRAPLNGAGRSPAPARAGRGGDDKAALGPGG